MTETGTTHDDPGARAARRSDIVPAEVIQTFVGKVEPGDHVSFAVVLVSVLFCLLVVFGTTAWWMLK